MANSSSGEFADVTHSSEIEQKLNQILEQQKSKISSRATVATQTAGIDSNTDEEVDKLKAEIYNLRQQLIEAENNSVNNKQTSSGGLATDILSAEEDAIKSVEIAKNNEVMVVKFKELESRLAEYEIIADDIAELSQLRADNAKLKEQLLNAQSESTAKPTPEAQPTKILEAQPIIVEQPITGQPADVSEESSVDLSGQAMVDALFAEANAGATTESESAVPDSDQNLLNEFEKITQKKGNE